MFVKFELGNLESFPERLNQLLKKHQESIDSIIKNQTDSYEDSFKLLDDLENERELFFTPLSHINSVLNSKETQKAYEESSTNFKAGFLLLL